MTEQHWEIAQLKYFGLMVTTGEAWSGRSLMPFKTFLLSQIVCTAGYVRSTSPLAFLIISQSRTQNRSRQVPTLSVPQR